MDFLSSELRKLKQLNNEHFYAHGNVPGSLLLNHGNVPGSLLLNQDVAHGLDVLVSVVW